MKVNGISFCGSVPLNYSKLELKPQDNFTDSESLWKSMKSGDTIQINIDNNQSTVGLITNFKVTNAVLDEYEFDCINLTELTNKKEFSTLHLRELCCECAGNRIFMKHDNDEKEIMIKDLVRLGHLDVYA